MEFPLKQILNSFLIKFLILIKLMLIYVNTQEAFSLLRSKEISIAFQLIGVPIFYR